MVKALLIDDDLELSDLMQAVLSKYNIDLDTASSPEAGFRALEKQAYEVLLLDIMLPEMDGLQFCRIIRASSANYRDLPIIMLTARTDLTDIVVGLEIGADDYIKKPFEPRELVARITAVLRRFDPSGTIETKGAAPGAESHARRQCQLLLDGNILTIDPERAQLLVNGTRLPITSMEFELIKAMALSPGEIYSRNELLGHVHTAGVLYARSIDALIYRLRSKIEQAGVNANFIRTVRGRGYALIGTRLL